MENSDLVIMTTAEAKPGKEKIVQQALRNCRFQINDYGFTIFTSRIIDR